MLIQFGKCAVFADQGFDKALLLPLKPEYREIRPQQHLVADSHGHNMFDSARGRVITEGGLIAADIQVYIRPEPAHHDGFLNETYGPMCKDEIHCWEEPRSIVKQNGLA